MDVPWGVPWRCNSSCRSPADLVQTHRYKGTTHLPTAHMRDLHPWESLPASPHTGHSRQVTREVANPVCLAGEQDFDRPGFDLPGMPTTAPTALACSSACDKRHDCLQRAWRSSSQACWLKNLLSQAVGSSGFCSATRKQQPGPRAELFPVGNYTPFGACRNFPVVSLG